jgi:hypothetical protein
MGRLARPVAIGVRVEAWSARSSKCMATTVCATLSAIVGTPSTRTPEPCGLGISTALTGGGK